jgi:tetratricopeptide (TPR) repeat protein
MRLSGIACLVVAFALVAATGRVNEPESAEPYLRRAYAAYAKGEFDRARQELDQAIRLDPKSALAFCYRGAVWFAQKQYDQAIRDLDRSIELQPGKPSSGYYLRGAAGI